MENIVSQQDLDTFALIYNQLEAKVNCDNFDQLSLAELKLLHAECVSVQKQYRNLELTVKRDGNSIYGAMASIYFSLVDFQCAGDITNAGKHFTSIVDRELNYFLRDWGANELLILRKMYPNLKRIRKFTEYKAHSIDDVCVYGDTDSRYVDLGLIYSLMYMDDGNGGEYQMTVPDLQTEEGKQECADFGEFFVGEFGNNIIKNILDYDIGFRQARTGYMKMAHEVTAGKSIYRAKKNYIMPVFWKDGRILPDVKLKTVGVEMQKGGLNPTIKKIIKKLVNDYVIDGKDGEYIRLECIKLMKYMRAKGERKNIYRINGVNDLHVVKFDEEKKIYYTNDTHQTKKMVVFWMNFIYQNNLTHLYKPPFEGQKMYTYYDLHDNIVAVPDDVDIDSVKGLPQPNYNRMMKEILVKNILKYISDKPVKEISNKDVDNFLAGIRKLDFL